MLNGFGPVLSYIEKAWQNNLTPAYGKPSGNMRNLIMRFGRVGLPNAISAPNDAYFAGTQFYWDSYFTILGLVDSNRAQNGKDMVDNLCFLFTKFGLIPARNSWTSLGRSQPPFLTQMAFEIYDHKGADEAWMDKVMDLAKQEYDYVWMNHPRLDSRTGLNQYHPKYFSKFLTVFESGWDMSSRFKKQANNIIPIDLNCLLYQYESDFLKWAKHKKDSRSQQEWQQALEKRERLINTYCWHKDFYYDYNLANDQYNPLETLAGFYPLWCGVAGRKQAAECVAKLHQFEHAGGLASTTKLLPYSNQWDYPNGWAPLQYIVISGLRRYGYTTDADRIAKKWLDCNNKVFASTGKLWEKYDVVRCDVGLPGRYPTQSGFGWTNGVYVRLTEKPETSDSQSESARAKTVIS